MSRTSNLMAGRAEDLDAGSGGCDRLGKDQGDRVRHRVEYRFWRRVGLDQLRVGEDGLRKESGGDRKDCDRKPPREVQE